MSIELSRTGPVATITINRPDKLNALSLKMYEDLGHAFMEARGRRSGETVLLRALEALQGERYLRLAEKRPANEAFLYGWLANRIGS